jgi:hypothetical protein
MQDHSAWTLKSGILGSTSTQVNKDVKKLTMMMMLTAQQKNRLRSNLTTL